jgi:hypothetical protein
MTRVDYVQLSMASVVVRVSHSKLQRPVQRCNPDFAMAKINGRKVKYEWVDKVVMQLVLVRSVFYSSSRLGSLSDSQP